MTMIMIIIIMMMVVVVVVVVSVMVIRWWVHWMMGMIRCVGYGAWREG